MIPVGYMAKRVSKSPDCLEASKVIDIYSVSGCMSKAFADYTNYWKHNGYWFFDSPEIIQNVAKEHLHQLEGTSLFYYEAHELQFDDRSWQPYAPEPSSPTDIIPPPRLLRSFAEAENHLINGAFQNSEPGPYRIFSVYSVDGPATYDKCALGRLSVEY
jgi:hypothetical protein